VRPDSVTVVAGAYPLPPAIAETGAEWLPLVDLLRLDVKVSQSPRDAQGHFERAVNYHKLSWIYPPGGVSRPTARAQ